jgi:hypothetical protein
MSRNTTVCQSLFVVLDPDPLLVISDSTNTSCCWLLETLNSGSLLLAAG